MTSDPELGTTVLPPAMEASCRIGVDEMDSQHVRIFHALQRLQESLEGPFPLETLGARLKLLEALVLEHFRDEEHLMECRGYPHVLPHRAEHELLIEKCHILLRDYIPPGPLLPSRRGCLRPDAVCPRFTLGGNGLSLCPDDAHTEKRRFPYI